MKSKKQTERTPEGFPEPRTFPEAWDGFALMATNGYHQGRGGEALGNEKSNPIDWRPEKFPKPRTYPKNWSIDD